MAENGHNMQSIKSNNPFPCSTRWISFLVESIKLNDSRNFNTKVCVEMMDFLKMPHKMDGGVLVVCENLN
jgi:hypothetical protein